MLSFRCGAVEVELGRRSIWVEAPLLGQVFASPDGIRRDSPAAVRAARQRLVASVEAGLTK